jgi:uncharacterized damage-inducible protein DinB
VSDERVDPPYVAGERPMLESFLDYHRDTLLRKCAGLADAQLKLRSVEPSSLSLLGLVRHMTEVERSWFRRVLTRDPDIPPLYYDDTNVDGDFDDVDDADAAGNLAAYRAEVDIARAVARDFDSLDAAGLRRGEEVSMRWIYIHMIEEYARHNGHADLLRECIDGVTGE